MEPNKDEKLEKTVTKTYFACKACKTKLQSIDFGSGSDIFGFSGKQKALYCDNKECSKYGDLTVVGIKIEE